ncbi:hypothetical protein DPM19_03360 [Actinomadura craniellae]|uniref:Asp23/Gls24 family envelope stress response protein n=1 Tax=Actinomadura craniellae TaxID=2231787 RepID=A0A365HDS4_9ACTN|nr:Asp23/Gls24 family envelope stress response protein [Actinomadura craniellae]RAY17199.1 hypothetical protein DPM19_03360 [Actinomadura craniellae]
MTDLGTGFAGPGDDPSGVPRRPRPFFPSPPGSSGSPLSAPAPAPQQVPVATRQATPAPAPALGDPTRTDPDAGATIAATPSAVVKGRITIGDEVVEKIAAFAVLEVPGVAGLGAAPDRERPVRVRKQDSEIAVELSVVVEYGSVIMDVAKRVKANVARVVALMVGLRVTSVDVDVEDVRLPEGAGTR